MRGGGEVAPLDRKLHRLDQSLASERHQPHSDRHDDMGALDRREPGFICRFSAMKRVERESRLWPAIGV